MNKKLLKGLTLVLSVASVSGMVSCSTPSGNSSSVSNGGGVVDYVPTVDFDTTKDVEITFYHTMGKALQEVFDAYLEDFCGPKGLYPNIKVTSQVIGTYDDVRDQMTTTLSSGNNDVNLAYCYPDHVALYNKAKSVISLDGLITSKYGLSKAEDSDFIKAYYDEGKSFGDGKMYTLPFSKSSEVLYYNKTFFDANNLQVPTHWVSTGADDVTSMEYVLKEIKKIDANSIPLGYDSESNLFITMCEQFGADYTAATGETHYLFNNDNAKNFMKMFKGWYDNGYLTTKKLYGGYTSTLFTTDDPQHCYMCLGSSAGATYQLPKDEKFEVSIAQIPQNNPEHKAVIQQGPNICIFKNGDEQKVIASWLLTKFFLTNVEFQAQFSMVSGYTPVLKSVAEDTTYKNWLNGNSIQAKSTKICMDQVDNYFTSPAFVGSSKARENVGNLVAKIFREDGSDAQINAAFENAIVECNQ